MWWICAFPTIRVMEEWDLRELNDVLIPIIPLGHVTHEAVASMKKNQLKQYLKEQAVKAYESKGGGVPQSGADP